MIRIIPSNKRYSADHGWLQTRWHFSFGDYYDPANMNWGALRVFNDDVLLGGGGFEPHPHRDMEIVTIVLEGALRHGDSLGHTGRILPGEVQVMSAGKGITHSEHNDSPTAELHLLQLWIMPRHRNNTPRWEQKAFDPAVQLNQLAAVVSGGNVPGTLSIDQDASIYLSTLEAGKLVTHTTVPARKPYLFVISGSVTINGTAAGAGDQARIENESSLEIRAEQDARIILLDLPAL